MNKFLFTPTIKYKRYSMLEKHSSILYLYNKVICPVLPFLSKSCSSTTPIVEHLTLPVSSVEAQSWLVIRVMSDSSYEWFDSMMIWTSEYSSSKRLRIPPLKGWIEVQIKWRLWVCYEACVWVCAQSWQKEITIE